MTALISKVREGLMVELGSSYAGVQRGFPGKGFQSVILP